MNNRKPSHTLLCALLALLTAMASTGAAPNTQHDCSAEKASEADLKKRFDRMLSILGNQGIVTDSYYCTWILQAKRVEGNKLFNVWFAIRPNRGRGAYNTTWAKEGEVILNSRGFAVLTLHHCLQEGSGGSPASLEKIVEGFALPSDFCFPKTLIAEEYADLRQSAPSSLQQKLILAFGEGCPELNLALRLDLPKRGLLLAADEFAIQPDGKVKLTPCSIVQITEERAKDGSPTFTTVRSGSAYLTFDHPPESISDLGSRKLLGVELQGGVRLSLDNR